MRTLIFVGIGAIGLLVCSCQRDAALKVPSCCAKESAAPAALADPMAASGASIYQMPGLWTDQHNHSFALDDLKGKVRVMAMVFTHCGYACPRLVQDMLAIQKGLPSAERDKVGFVLVSFDADRDDPARLAGYAGQQGLDGHWTLLHGNAAQVRELSLLLNVRYQRLEDSNFTHSNAIIILDQQGAISRRLTGLEPATDSAIQFIHRLNSKTTLP